MASKSNRTQRVEQAEKGLANLALGGHDSDDSDDDSKRKHNKKKVVQQNINNQHQHPQKQIHQKNPYPMMKMIMKHQHIISNKMNPMMKKLIIKIQIKKIKARKIINNQILMIMMMIKHL